MEETLWLLLPIPLGPEGGGSKVVVGLERPLLGLDWPVFDETAFASVDVVEELPVLVDTTADLGDSLGLDCPTFVPLAWKLPSTVTTVSIVWSSSSSGRMSFLRRSFTTRATSRMSGGKVLGSCLMQ